MHTCVSTLYARAPPEHRHQLQWIIETVTQRTNELRGNLCLISAASLFDPRPGRHTKSSRLLAVYLVRNLLHWPASTINAVFSPASYPHSSNLLTQARQWVCSGCFDALSGLSMAPVKEHIVTAFGTIFPPPQNVAKDDPPDPPPRRKPPELKPAAREISQPKARNRAAKALRSDGGKSPSLPEQPSAPPVRMVAVPPPPPLRVPVPIGLHEHLANAPFVRQLHPRLVEAAVATEFNVKEFVADMIAEAMQRKAPLSPLAPQPFLQALSCASLDVPEQLAPHALFIQQTLCDFAEGLSARSRLQAPAALIRPVRPLATALGD